MADPAGRIAFGPVSRYTIVAQLLGGIYAIDPDGSDAVRILPCEVERPRFSPDGSRLAFSIVMSDGSFQIATVAVDGSDLHILTSTLGYAEWPDWTPDGSSIIYALAPDPCDMSSECSNVHHSIWQMDSDGSNQRPMWDHDELDYGAEARLSPDGSEIVFDSYDATTDSWALTIRNLATGEERRLTTTNTGDIVHPDWTRDGKSVIYNTNQDGSAGIGQQIEIVPADDPNAPPTYIYGDVKHDAFKPAFSPDGSQIVFGCGLPICLMNADGSNVTVLAEAPDVELNHPAWGVNLPVD